MNGSAIKQSPRTQIMDASRRLFGSKGFHSTPMAELAAEARVSVGQIYRLFPGKDDIIVAIVENDAREHLDMLEEMFERIDGGELSPADGIERFACNALVREDQALSFEILAESYRNPRVAEVVHNAQARYRELVQRMVLKAKPELGAAALAACVEIMTACFYGLGLGASAGSSLSVELLSRAAGCLILRGMGVQLSDAPYLEPDCSDGQNGLRPRQDDETP